MRVYDDPNHPQYGPVRRLWIILAGLGLLGAVEQKYHGIFGAAWDDCMADAMKDRAHEASVAKLIVRRMIDIERYNP